MQLPLQQQWYFGQIKRANAGKLLDKSGGPTGTFLIRDSESQPGNYALSVRYGICVKHYFIKKTDTGKTACCLALFQIFEHVVVIIQLFRPTPLRWHRALHFQGQQTWNPADGILCLIKLLANSQYWESSTIPCL